MSIRVKGKDILVQLSVMAVVAIFFFPYLFMVSSAFKSRLETFAYPPVWIFRPSIENFRAAIADINLPFYMKNSAIVSVASTALTMLVAIPATLSFARFQFWLKEKIAYGFLFLQMIPGISVVFSFFFLAQRFRILDTYLVLIVTYLLWNIPYAIWMMRGFVEGIPVELEESAMIDGCSRLRAFYYVTLPLAAPGLAATAILIFIGCWNEFTLAFFLTSVKARTLPTTIAFFLTHSGIEWGPMFATATIGTLPVVVFALLVRRYFVRALTFGALKE